MRFTQLARLAVVAGALSAVAVGCSDDPVVGARDTGTDVTADVIAPDVAPDTNQPDVAQPDVTHVLHCWEERTEKTHQSWREVFVQYQLQPSFALRPNSAVY